MADTINPATHKTDDARRTLREAIGVALGNRQGDSPPQKN